MRRMIVMAVCFGVVACEQNKAAEAANTPGWTQTSGAGEVVLLNQTVGGNDANVLAKAVYTYNAIVDSQAGVSDR